MNTVTVKLDPSQHDELDRLARESQRDLDALVGEAIGQYLDLRAWQAGKIEEGLRQADAGEFASDEEVEAVFAKWRSR